MASIKRARILVRFNFVIFSHDYSSPFSIFMVGSSVPFTKIAWCRELPKKSEFRVYFKVIWLRLGLCGFLFKFYPLVYLWEVLSG
jgi:hypothetical protein